MKRINVETLRDLLSPRIPSSVCGIEVLKDEDTGLRAICRCGNGERLFLKASNADSYEREQAALEMLQRLGVRVPAVVCRFVHPEESLFALVLEYVEDRERNATADDALVDMLVTMHAVTNDRFGYAVDGDEPNSWRERWDDFFFRNRLLYQAEVGVRRGWFTIEFERILRQKIEHLRQLLAGESCQPSLLHGALFPEHVLYSSTGPVLIDPSPFFGDREFELAACDPALRALYLSGSPLAHSESKRAALYRLYYLIRRANLLGRDEEGEVWRMLKAI